MRYTYSGYITLLRDFTANDDISEAILARYLNEGAGVFYTRVHNDKNRTTKTFSIGSSTDTYKMPIGINHIVSMKVTIGTSLYPIWPIENQRKWDLIKSSPFTASQPTHFFVRGRDLIFYPTPASTQTITVVGEAIAPPLGIADYTTGTISLTNASATVTGSGTTFTAGMVGRYLMVARSVAGDGYWYKVSAFSSTTSITLEQAYEGSSVSGVAYTLGEQFDLPEDLQLGPAVYAAMRYFQNNRRNRGKLAEFKNEYEEILAVADSKYGFKTTYPISGTRTMQYTGMNANNWPQLS